MIIFEIWYCEIFDSNIFPLQSSKEIGRVEGANAPALTKTVQHHATSFVAPIINENNQNSAEVRHAFFLKIFSLHLRLSVNSFLASPS